MQCGSSFAWHVRGYLLCLNASPKSRVVTKMWLDDYHYSGGGDNEITRRQSADAEINNCGLSE